MKRTLKYMLCLTALIFMGAGQLSAQHYIGIRGGYGSGSARIYPKPEMGTVWGLYHGGVSWKYYTAEPFVGGVEVDAILMQQGFKVWHMSTEQNKEDRQRTGYDQRIVNTVMVPMFWQPHVYMFRQRLRVFLNLGVTFSYVTGSTQRQVSFTDNTDVESDYEMKLTRDNRFGYGLCGGGGLSYSAGRFEIFTEVRYYIGYSDILKNWNKNEQNRYLRTPLDGLQIAAGLYFRLGKDDIKSPQGKGINRDIVRRIEQEAAAKKSEEAPQVDIFVPDDGEDALITIEAEGDRTTETEAAGKKSRRERRAESRENKNKTDDGYDQTTEGGKADTERH